MYCLWVTFSMRNNVLSEKERFCLINNVLPESYVPFEKHRAV